MALFRRPVTDVAPEWTARVLAPPTPAALVSASTIQIVAELVLLSLTAAVLMWRTVMVAVLVLATAPVSAFAVQW